MEGLLRWFLGPLVRWRARRRVARDLERRLAAWAALPPEERRKWVHPASPTKPPGWTADEFRATRNREHDA